MRTVKFLSVFALLVLMLGTTLAMGQGPTDTVLTEEDVRGVLLDYSASLPDKWPKSPTIHWR